jgi:hypothetical protein
MKKRTKSLLQFEHQIFVLYDCTPLPRNGRPQRIERNKLHWKNGEEKRLIIVSKKEKKRKDSD